MPDTTQSPVTTTDAPSAETTESSPTETTESSEVEATPEITDPEITDSETPTGTTDDPISSGDPVSPTEETPTSGELSEPDNSTTTELFAPPPPVVEAPQEAVQAAKSAPPEFVDAVAPPPPPVVQRVDFNVQINNVIENKPNIVVNNTVRADHWTYLDYDDYRRPIFYNPYDEPFTVRYFYEGAYREVWVPIGRRIVINVPGGGVFPFTACSRSYVQVGNFYGGGFIPPLGWVGPPPPTWRPPPPPVVYTHPVVRVVKVNRTVRVNKVTVVGHDDNKPVGQRDVFTLDDTTLAWGTDKGNGQVEIAATQSLPWVGPIDDGGLRS